MSVRSAKIILILKIQNHFFSHSFTLYSEHDFFARTVFVYLHLKVGGGTDLGEVYLLDNVAFLYACLLSGTVFLDRGHHHALVGLLHCHADDCALHAAEVDKVVCNLLDYVHWHGKGISGIRACQGDD